MRLIASLVDYELGEEEALKAWGEILEHKWSMSERVEMWAFRPRPRIISSA